MMCAWKELVAILPLWMRSEVDRLGAESLQELRLRRDAAPEMVFSNHSSWLNRAITQEDLQYIVNTASRYSPWATATSGYGYITSKGGHRIGLCGEVTIQNGHVTGVGRVSSLCIRIARDYPDIAESVKNYSGSILILGPPGWGKTTLLRDMIRQISQRETVCVVDERQELFPDGFLYGKRMDVLSGCPKRFGIGMLLRTMGPDCIAVDEITDPEDCQSLLHAANCGVRLLATAHASDLSDLHRRSLYRPLLENGIFDYCFVLRKNQTFTIERMKQWATNALAQF